MQPLGKPVDSVSKLNPMAIARWCLSVVLILTALYFVFGGNNALQAAMEASVMPTWVWLLISCFVYAFVLMVPFAPGLELGLLIMSVFGVMGILGAWLATVVGLSCAFLIGRSFRHFPAVKNLYERLEHSDDLPVYIQKVKAALTRYPYLSVAVLINIPGNSFLGGGGGISIASGAVGNMKLGYFAITVTMASCLIPLLLYTGVINFS